MPKFTKRHYETVADVLHTVLTHDSATLFTDSEITVITTQFAKVFGLDNPAFKPDRFIVRVWEGV